MSERTIKGRDELIREQKAKIPEDWTVERDRLTGNFKQILEIRHPEHGRIQIQPHKSYDDVPGFPNCHRVDHLDEDGRHEIATGMDVEHPATAIETAAEYARDLEDSATEGTTDDE
ncbi:hypothetical protein [Natrinema pallidum]|uniref:hypothetical protein n=1 Tax=Natrinema pallidum TaxID=69527 RepID=UPI003753CA41